MAHNTGRKLKQTEMLLFHSSAMAEFHCRALENKIITIQQIKSIILDIHVIDIFINNLTKI